MMLALPLLAIAMSFCSVAQAFGAVGAQQASTMMTTTTAFQPLLQPPPRHTVHFRCKGRVVGRSSQQFIGSRHTNSCACRMTTDNEQTDSFIYTCLDNSDSGIDESGSCQRNLGRVLHTMEKAAYAAGEVALSTAGKIAVKTSKANARDLVTESDLECQRLIKEIILKEFPNDVFLGEEGIDLSGDSSGASSDALKVALGIAEEGGGDGKLLFIVASDPIDGTTNFQAGLPIYAMSIGVVSLAGSTPEVVAGVIYNPTLGEMMSAVRGRGCYLNSRRINAKTNQNDNTRQQPRNCSILSQSLINVGFPVCKESTLLVSSRAVTALATKVRGLRMVACASQAMAWVAQSKFSSYFSWDLNAWDVAAGIVIIEEAGGLVSNFDGTKADISSRDMIMTCCPDVSGEEVLLRDELIQILKDNDCVQY